MIFSWSDSKRKAPGRKGSILLAISLFLVTAVPAEAAKRLAFVVGNDAYTALPKLKKAVNDARAITAVLKDIGFQVMGGENWSRRRMNRGLARFLGQISPGDQVFFYFAGHGVALGAENYLIPSDMPKPGAGEESLVRDEGYAVSRLIARVQARGAGSTMFVLDACRNNPFASVGVRSIGAARGFARMDAPNGVFVLFSAGIGQAALDGLPGDGPRQNSVFTRKLVPLLRTPGLTHVQLAKQVQRQVDALARTAAPAVSRQFTLAGGRSLRLKPSGAIVSFIGTPYGARSDLAGVALRGKRQSMSVGEHIAVQAGSSKCTLTLTALHRGQNKGSFEWRCQ